MNKLDYIKDVITDYALKINRAKKTKERDILIDYFNKIRSKELNDIVAKSKFMEDGVKEFYKYESAVDDLTKKTYRELYNSGNKI